MTAYDPTRDYATAAEVFRHLLLTQPGRTVSVADVAVALGRPVSRQAVCEAARRLRRGHFGIPVTASKRGGYRVGT